MKKKTIFGIIVAVVAVILAVVIVLVIRNNTTSVDDGSDDPNYDASVEEDITYQQVDINTLAETLVNDPDAAAEQYNSLYVELSGTVSEVDSNGNYIVLSAISDTEDVAEVAFTCYFDPAQEDLMTATYEVGQEITVTGKILSADELTGYALTIDTAK